MKKVQSADELNAYYTNEDPWGYYTNREDSNRKLVLLSAIKGLSFSRALDIGCGNGFITRAIPAREVIGVDISENAIKEARRRAGDTHVRYETCSLFELSPSRLGLFDCILITGVLYNQYIGKALPLVYMLLDEMLEEDGTLISVHIEEWNFARFPYAIIHKQRYRYREYNHLLEIYRK